MDDLVPIGYQLIIVTFVSGFVSLATLSVRLWFRVRQRKDDVSDTFLIAAMLCAIIQGAIQLILVFQFDYGKPKADIPTHLRTSDIPSKLAYVNQILFKLTTPMSKLSLCLLYRAVCSTSTDRVIRMTRVAIWGTMFLTVGAYGSAFLISIFQCTPIDKMWNKKVDGMCINLTAFRMRLSVRYDRIMDICMAFPSKLIPRFLNSPYLHSTAVFNLITSALVITLPIPTLLKLKQQRPEVKQLLGLILLGFVHTGLTIARFVIMFYPHPLAKTEPQYAHIMPNCLAVVEADIGIWVATLFVMQPAFHALYHVFCACHGPEISTTLYYGRSGTRKTSNAYYMNILSARSNMMEDEHHILETTEIRVTSEGDLTERITSNNSDAHIASYYEEKQVIPAPRLGYRASVTHAG